MQQLCIWGARSEGTLTPPDWGRSDTCLWKLDSPALGCTNMLTATFDTPPPQQVSLGRGRACLESTLPSRTHGRRLEGAQKMLKGINGMRNGEGTMKGGQGAGTALERNESAPRTGVSAQFKPDLYYREEAKHLDPPKETGIKAPPHVTRVTAASLIQAGRKRQLQSPGPS